MKKINDKKRLESYLKTSKLDTLLSSYDLVMYELDRQEILNEKLNPRRFMLFLAEGKVRIMSYRIDGNCYQVNDTAAPNCFGDMEFALPEMRQHRIETITPCVFLALDLAKEKSKIEKDPQFLMYLLRSVSYKVTLTSDVYTETSDIKSKVIYYLEHEAVNEEIHGVGNLCQHLNCSRRQLQRILKQLQGEGYLVKTGKGKYKKGTPKSVV